MRREAGKKIRIMKKDKPLKPKKTFAAKTTGGKSINTNRVSIVTNRDIWSSHPSGGLTPEKLASLLREAESGDISRQMELFEEIEEKDLHIVSCLNDRKDAVKNKKWKIKPASENPFDIKVADYCNELIKGIKRWREIVYNISDAVGKGLSLQEIMWQPGEILKIGSIDYIMPKKIAFNDNLTEIRLITESAPVFGIPLEPNKFVLHKSQCKSGHPSRGSLLRLCSWFFLFKNFAIKDWATFAEIYGMPLRVAKYDKNSGDEEKKVLEIALRQLGVDASALIPAECDIEIKESDKRSSGDIYDRLSAFCNQEISKAIIGSTLTKEIGDTGGAYSASETHREVKEEIIESDAKELNETIREDILRPAVTFQFGENVEIPEYETVFEKAVDYDKLADTYGKLVNIGFEIPLEHAHTVFNIPQAKESEKILKKQETFGFMNGEPLSGKGQSGAEIFAANQRVDTIAQKIARSKQNKDSFKSTIENYIDKAGDIYSGRIYDLQKKIENAADFAEAVKIISEEKIDIETYLKFGNMVFEALRESAEQGRLDARIETNVFSAKAETANQTSELDPFKILPESAIDFLKVYSFETAAIKEKTAIENVRASFEKALREGQTFEQYKKENAGLWGSENKHIQTIFYTNMETLYAAGKYWEYNDPAHKERFPYFMYLTVGDENVREEHRGMHGKVFRRGDKVWDKWWPPNGFNCRCDVIMVSDYEMKQRNLRISSTDEAITMRDKNFERNAGKLLDFYKLSEELVNKYDLNFNNYEFYGLEKLKRGSAPIEKTISSGRDVTLDEYKQKLGLEETDEKIINDVEGNSVNLHLRTYDKFIKNEDTKYRLEYLDFVIPTITAADEVWGILSKAKDSIKLRKGYIKRFIETGTNKIIDIEVVTERDFKNDLVTWINVNKIDTKRKGFLLFINKEERP